MALQYSHQHGIPGPEPIVKRNNSTDVSPGGNHVYLGRYKVENGHMISGNVFAQGDIYIETQSKTLNYLAFI